MPTKETAFLTFWRDTNAPLVALGLPPISLGEAQRLYELHRSEVERELVPVLGTDERSVA